MNYKQFYFAPVIALHTGSLSALQTSIKHNNTPMNWVGCGWKVFQHSVEVRPFEGLQIVQASQGSSRREKKSKRGMSLGEILINTSLCSVFSIISLSLKRSRYQIQKTKEPNSSKKFFIYCLRQTPAEPC